MVRAAMFEVDPFDTIPSAGNIDPQKIENIFFTYFQTRVRPVIDRQGYITLRGPCKFKIFKSEELKQQMPVKFKKTGTFMCENANLLSLVGSPIEVSGHFNCNRNPIKTLEGGPRSVGGSFHCRTKTLVSLKGAPETVTGTFNCFGQYLTSLEGLPNTLGSIDMSYNPNLPLLRLLKVSGEIHIDDMAVQKILRKYQSEDNLRANLIACQKELIDAGYEGNAAW